MFLTEWGVKAPEYLSDFIYSDFIKASGSELKINFKISICVFKSKK